MSFKGLCLNRELIDTSLKTYGEHIDIIREEKQKFIEYKISLPNQETALFQVFYNNNFRL